MSTKLTFDEVVERKRNLRGADLRGADLHAAGLRDADLRNANLRDADLRNAGLRNAILRGAGLRNANLRNANLRDADLRNADLYGADLRDADLRGADIRGANLDYAAWPLCCGSSGIKVGARIFRQLVDHLLVLEVDDEESRAAQEYLRANVTRSHRAEDLGLAVDDTHKAGEGDWGTERAQTVCKKGEREEKTMRKRNYRRWVLELVVGVFLAVGIGSIGVEILRLHLGGTAAQQGSMTALGVALILSGLALLWEMILEVRAEWRDRR